MGGLKYFIKVLFGNSFMKVFWGGLGGDWDAVILY